MDSNSPKMDNRKASNCVLFGIAQKSRCKKNSVRLEEEVGLTARYGADAVRQLDFGRLAWSAPVQGGRFGFSPNLAIWCGSAPILHLLLGLTSVQLCFR